MGHLDFERTLMYLAVADAVLLGLCLLTGLLLRWTVRRIDPVLGGMTRPAWTRLLVGAVVAVVALALTLAPAGVAGAYRAGQPGWQPFDHADGESVGLLGTWLLFALQSLAEELVFRGVAMALVAGLALALISWVLRRLGKDHATGAPQRAWLWTGLLVNVGLSVLFGLVHADNPNVTQIAVFNVVLASLVLGQLMWNQTSILGAWIFHWVWNALVVTLGFPISGVRLAAPISGFGVTGARDGLLTGGQFGPEGSLPCTVALSLAFAFLLYKAAEGVRESVRAAAAADTVGSDDQQDREQSEPRLSP
jgi:membrane protease YdiL (CAAX protease family)